MLKITVVTLVHSYIHFTINLHRVLVTEAEKFAFLKIIHQNLYNGRNIKRAPGQKIVSQSLLKIAQRIRENMKLCNVITDREGTRFWNAEIR